MLAPVNLLFLTALANLICLGVLGSLWRSRIAGIREAACAAVLMTLAVLGFSLQATGGPAVLAYQVSNFIYTLSYCLFVAGVYRFLGRPAPLAFLAACLAANTAVMALFYYVWPSTTTRIVWASGLHMVLSLALLRQVLSGAAQAYRRYSYRFTAGIALVAALGHGTRSLIHLLALADPTVLAPASWNLAFLTLGVVIHPSLTLGLIMMIHDRMLGEREREADTDYLTGLSTRKAWRREAQRLHDQALAGARPWTVLALDIDHFKQVNDAHGHAAGDQVLRDFAGLLRSRLRDGDVVGRTGGEEFLVALPGTGLAQAEALALRLQQAVRSHPSSAGGAQLPYTFSGGLAECRADDTLESLIQRADRALYAAKRMGRDALVLAPVQADRQGRG